MRVQAEAEALLANVDYEEGAPARALEHYREAGALLEASGDTGAAIRCQVAVGQILLQLGYIREAVAELRAAVDRAPNDALLQTQLALAVWQLGESRAALAILTDVLMIDGGNRDALRIRGEIYADLGDARNAMLDLERQSVLDRPSAQAAHGLALAELSQHSAAAREIDAAVETAPQNGRVLLYAARASALTGDKVRSWELARRAADAKDPPLSPSHRKFALDLVGDE
jgi:tetratricopeptide (TPR) repeat protein